MSSVVEHLLGNNDVIYYTLSPKENGNLNVLRPTVPTANDRRI